MKPVQIDGQWYKIECVIIADHDQQSVLQEKWGKQLGWKNDWRTRGYAGLPTQGLNISIGKIDGYPTGVTLNWAWIGQNIFCLCDPSCRIVDYDRIHEWIKTNLSPNTIMDRPFELFGFAQTFRNIGINIFAPGENNQFVITGISSGLGRVLALELAKDPGAQIIGTMRRKRHEDDLFRHDNVTIVDECDLLNDDACTHIAGLAEQKFTGPFSFLHCVGETTEHESFQQFPTARAKTMFASHVMTLYNTLQYLVPVMKQKGGGNCVAFSCNSTKYHYPLMATFTAAKSAVDSLIRSLANEFSGDKIRFNSLALSTVWSEREAKLKPHGDVEHYIKPDDIAKIIPFLTSSDAHLISGNSINLFEPSDTFYRTGYLERIRKD